MSCCGRTRPDAPPERIGAAAKAHRVVLAVLDPAPRRVQDLRRAVCGPCEHRKRWWFVWWCWLCGCILPLKQRWYRGRCAKWTDALASYPRRRAACMRCDKLNARGTLPACGVSGLTIDDLCADHAAACPHPKGTRWAW